MISSLSIYAALGAMLCWGFGDFIIQKATRVIGDIEALTWIGFVGTIGLLPFVWHDLSQVFAESNLVILLTLGIITFVVGIINFEALRRGKISVVEIILEAELPIAILLGLFFLHELLTGYQLILTLLIFGGIMLIAAKPGQIKKSHFFEKGVILASVAALGYGLIDFLTDVGAKLVSPLLTIWFTWLTFTLICFVYISWRKGFKQFFKNASSYKQLVLGIGIIDTVAWVLFAVALRGNSLAITVAISESYPAIGLILGATVNREKVVAR